MEQSLKKIVFEAQCKNCSKTIEVEQQIISTNSDGSFEYRLHLELLSEYGIDLICSNCGTDHIVRVEEF